MKVFLGEIKQNIYRLKLRGNIMPEVGFCVTRKYKNYCSVCRLWEIPFGVISDINRFDYFTLITIIGLEKGKAYEVTKK